MSENISKVSQYQELIAQVKSEISKKVVGQQTMIRDILICLFSQGHILIEGAPGLAKTLSVETVSKILDFSFKRIQFTPDLLPSDLIGSQIYNPAKQDFFIKFGPIFSNFVLADEINRAPSKVQSALLEAMAEKQVSIGEKTYKLDLPFMVLATQNPVEQEGTFSLPEAQLDRFLLKTLVSFPTPDEEIKIMKGSVQREDVSLESILNKEKVQEIQKVIEEIYVDDKILYYIKDIIFFSRTSKDEKLKYLNFPLSPRASISLLKAAKAHAFFQNRDFVLPEDVKEMVYPVLRHRLSLNYEAYADDVKSDELVEYILSQTPIV